MNWWNVFFILLLVTFSDQTNAQIGIFARSADIGKPKNAGSATYDTTSQSYRIRGSGYNIWFNRDEFHYLYNKIAGDFILTGNFGFVSQGGDPHRKIGWMIRESNDEAAASMNAVVHGDGLVVMQWRPLRGAYMRDPEDEIFFPKKVDYQVIQLERNGNRMTMRVANPGEPLQEVGSHEMTMPDSVLAGIYICSHNENATEEARVWNVRIDKPVANRYEPNPALARKAAGFTGELASRLEVVDVSTGERKIVHESDGRLEAPNWMPDGHRLLYNENGLLYTLPVQGGSPSEFNTGSVRQNNNDHGISFDRKMLALSSSVQGKPGGGSTVYVVPLTGGEPRQITKETPSYWHGWGPGGKEVLIVAQRNGSSIYNLYRVDINTGKETAITNNAAGHVDGPEYSPDGRFIYYNANPSGTMQLWRMKPDGSAREQLTFDEYHNWFPHISPDGKWIAFISFPPDIQPDAHPSYQRVMLRIMPATAAGAPRVIAHLYGGQGTINVNSWSPDSRRLAFVSNSELKR
jgi:TolB protein